MAVDEFSDYPDTGASGSQEYTSPEDASIDFTSQNPRTDYEPPQPDVDYGVGATGNVSTSGRTNSGGGLVAPFIHPFKLEKFTNPDDNSTKVRIYEGDVYAKIDTFQLDLISLTTSVESYSTADPPAGPSTKEQSLGSHSITFSDVTAQMPQHQHDVDGGTVLIPQHKHLARDSSEDGLVMPNHKHAAGSNLTATAGSTSADTGYAGAHSHSAGTYKIPDHQHIQGGTAKAKTGTGSGGITTGTTEDAGSHSHGSGGYNIPEHNHKAQEGSNKLLIPQHTHLPRNSGSDGLVIPDHVHSAGTDSTNLKADNHTHSMAYSVNTGTAVSSGSSYSPCNDTGHYHNVAISQNTGNISVGSNIDVSGDTDGVKDHDSSDGSERFVTGNTGNVDTSSSTALEITGNTGGLSTSTLTAVTGTSAVQAAHGHTYNKDDHSHDLDDNTQTGNIYDKANNDLIIGNSSTESSHKHSYTKDDHTHSVTGDTTEVTDYDSDVNEKRVTGETGSIKNYSTEDNKKCTGTTGDVRVGSSSTLPNFTISVSGSSSSSGLNHSHLVPALESSSTTHKFVAISGQAEAPLSTATNFAGTFNKPIQLDDGTDTVFMYHESSHSSGDFYVKWVITISEAAVVQNIVGSIERVAVGAGAPADISFGALTQHNTTKALSRDPARLTGTFHQKIGSVSGDSVDQKQFSNINWSMTVLPAVS